MKSVFTDHNHHSPSIVRKAEAFKKGNQHDQTFFGDTTSESFFKPGVSIQRKCAHCEAEEKNLSRMAGPKEEEKKIQKQGEKKEEEKIHSQAEKKEEEKIQREPEKKEENEKKIQRQPEKKEEEKVMPARLRKGEKKEKQINKKEGSGSSTSNTISSYVNSINSKGQSFPKNVRSFYESRMGSDFSDVKIHTSKEAQQSAKDINAQAYTLGRNIVFNEGKYQPDTHDGKRLLAHELTHVIQQTGKVQPHRNNNFRIQRIPAPGRDFGTPGYCGFGITTGIAGFIQKYMTENFNVDYTTGCDWIWWNAWGSLWELYDASDKKVASKSKTPFGTFDIEPSVINSGTPGDYSAPWSLWFRVTENQPWNDDDNDAYPYNYVIFPVYAFPYRNTNVTLKEEKGPVQWQENFTPPEDGASIVFVEETSESRTDNASQTTTVSVSARRDTTANIGFEYDGLTGGFSNALSLEAAASISRTQSLTLESHHSKSTTHNLTDLKGGVTYIITVRPLYHLIDGSVGLISQRDGVVSLGGDRTVKGAIKILKGIEFRADPEISATTKADTGDCTEEEHRRLQDEVNERCKDVKRACEKGMRCEETKSKMRRNEKCAQARERINKKCFKGGDAGHRRAAQEARRAQENCRQLIRENCK